MSEEDDSKRTRYSEWFPRESNQPIPLTIVERGEPDERGWSFIRLRLEGDHEFDAILKVILDPA